jgi:putative acetyltransferase
MMGASQNIAVELVSAATDEVRALIGELDRTLAAEYSAEERHGLPLEAIFAPHVRFFIARLAGGEAVGCGGVALFATFGEVKRMYVREAARGRGVARALIARIESETVRHGLSVLRLETGDSQIAARRLYERSGFAPCEVFGDYAAMSPAAIARSVFLQKNLMGTRSTVIP